MIGTDVVGPTAIDKDLAETQVGADLVLPSWARSILAIRPMVANATPTTVEQVNHKLHLTSEDFKVVPFEVLCAPTGACVGANAGAQAPEPPWYPMNCPVNGGDRLKVFGTGLVALTTAAYMMCQIIFSDKKAGSQIYGRVGTLTVSGAAGIYTAGTPYTITGGNTLKELVGFASNPGVTLEGMMGFLEWRSNDFKDPSPLRVPTNPMAPGIGSGGMGNTTGLSRTKVDIPILSPCQIVDSCTLTDVPTAGVFITGILYQ